MNAESLLKKAEQASRREDACAQLRALWNCTRAPELSALLARLNPLTLGTKPAQVRAALLKASPGPELTWALEQLLRDVPFTSDSSKPAWREVLSAVAKSGAPHFQALAATLPAQWKIRPLMTQWLGAQLRSAVRELPAAPEALPASAAARLQRLEEKWQVSREAPDATPFDAVFRDPSSDAVRQVCADALQARGDPRGEFIALQLSTDAAAQKRARALLKANLEKWLLPFEGAVSKSGVVFRRGFLAEATVNFRNQAHAERIGGLPDWATVEHLRFHNGSVSESLRRWTTYVSPAMKSLREVALPGDALPFLRAAHTPIEKLTVYSFTVEQLQSVLSAGVLPSLRELRVEYSAPEGWVEVVARANLHTVCCANQDFAVTMLKRLEASAVRQVVIRSPQTAEVRLTPDGNRWALELFMGPEAYPYPLIELLGSLRGRISKVGFAELTVLDADVVAAAHATLG
jgi:uncharacterized protein (TIGR02996 family)